MPNTLIRNAMIIDGTGREAFKGSIYVIGDRIEAVIPSTTAPDDDIARKEKNNIIDAEGLAVAPGFIDCHSHFDWVLPLSHHQEFLFPLIEQGITTVVTGNCGFSPAPVNADSKKLVREFSDILVAEPFAYNWEGMD
jgi:N-acyl-D-amino-acid deacylase